MSQPEIPLETFFPYRLHRIATNVSKQFAQIYAKEFGISISEWRVLATIAQFDSITAKQIALHSDMHKTKISRAVAKLEKRRWLKRRMNTLDRREELLFLSSAGRSAYNILVPKLAALENQILQKLGEDRDRLETFLRKMERIS